MNQHTTIAERAEVYIPGINQRAIDTHAANVERGWWTDLASGLSILATRDRGRIMMLCVSELSEADYGAENALRDDHLPQYPMFGVELGDTAIRLLDVLGAESSLHGGPAVDEKLLLEQMVGMHGRIARRTTSSQLMQIVNRISAALEHERKSRTMAYRGELQAALAGVMALAGIVGLDLWTVVDAKAAYNGSRADHKPENRLAADGKKS